MLTDNLLLELEESWKHGYKKQNNIGAKSYILFNLICLIERTEISKILLSHFLMSFKESVVPLLILFLSSYSTEIPVKSARGGEQ